MRTNSKSAHSVESEELDEETKAKVDEDRKKKGRNAFVGLNVAQELQEFLNVMKSRTTKKTWKNDEVTAESRASSLFQ